RALLRLRADGGDAAREPSRPRALGLEQRTEAEQVIGQSLEGSDALAAHLEPRERPGDLARPRRASRDEVAEAPQLVLRVGIDAHRRPARAAASAERHEMPAAYIDP